MGTVYKFNESISIEDGASPSLHDDTEFKDFNDRVRVFLSGFGEDQNSDMSRESDDTGTMNDVTMDQIDKKLSGIEDRMDKRVERIERETDRRSEEFRKEISLRDDTIRRELDLRRESFLAEQAIRDQAWEAKFSGFLSTQAERDKRLEESVSGIRADLTRLGSLKLNVWGAMLTAVGVGLAVAALSVSSYQTGKADKPAAEIVKPAPPPAVKPES